MENYEEIARRIKETAKKKNLPLRDLLNKCDLGINTISELSKGKSISFISFAKIAKCLNVSTDFLLGNVGALTDDLFRHLDTVCKTKGITFIEAMRQAGFTSSEIEKYYSGNRGVIFAKKEALADILDDDYEKWNALAFASSPVEPSSIDPSLTSMYNLSMCRAIPLFESVSAGFGAYADSRIVDYYPCYISNTSEANETLCIRVQGNSMSPKIEDGDIIQVRKQTSVDSGSIAVVLIGGEEGYVKKVNYGDDWIELISLNENYPPMRFEGEDVTKIQVVGLVKKVIKEI